VNWLRALIGGLLDSLFSWGQKQAEKPGTAQDANTPENIKRGWNNYVARELRDKPDGADRQPK
jgi:hypothetical protein